MADNSFKIKNSLVLTPVDLATLTNPQAGDLACDINDSNKIKRYDAASTSWTEVGSGAAGDVDTLLVQDFDSASLSSFTQTGLELITTNPLDGRQSARLVHQAASTSSFKQTLTVPPKFRGVNMTASLLLRSSASQGNVTIQFRDETNSVDYPSQQLQTNSQAIASLVTNSTTLVSGFSNSSINTLRVGMSVTGSGIPTGTTIASINSTALTITLSQAATASATVSLRFSDLPRTIQLGFNIPANCSSYSYTISALQEAGSPETYVDDIVLKNYWLGMSNQGQSSINVPTIEQQSSVVDQSTVFGSAATITGATSSTTGSGIYTYNSGAGTYTFLKSATVTISASLTTNAAAGASVAIRLNGADIAVDTTAPTTGFWANASTVRVVSVGDVISVFTYAATSSQKISVSAQSITTSTTTVNDLVPAKAVLGNTSLDIPNVTGWQGYTPTFQGFGTPTNVEFEWRQVGESVEIRGKFTAGTSTAVEARVGLPAGLTSAGTSLIPSIQIVGHGTYSASYAASLELLAEPSTTYLTFGIQSSTMAGITKQSGSFVLATGNSLSFFASVPCAGLSATSSKVVSGTQQALVQEADSVMARSNNAFTANWGSTLFNGLYVARFPDVLQQIGSDVAHSDSATTGSTFTIQTAGLYNISATATNSADVDDLLYININSSTIASQRYGNGSGNVQGNASATYYCRVGDVIRILAEGNNTVATPIIISRAGSLKQLNVSSDQKITIPTSELRFEGASARGTSPSNTIVKFDTLAKLRGDAFTVNNDSVLGTSIVMKKAGKLDISTCLGVLGTNIFFFVTKNQAILTGNGTNSERLVGGSAQTAADDLANISCSVKVDVGDIIRVSATANPVSSATNVLNLFFQEQEIAVSVTNTLPQFSESDLVVRAAGNAGQVIATQANIPFIIAYDSTGGNWNGTQFTIPETGTYAFSGSMYFTTSAYREPFIKVDGLAYRYIGVAVTSAFHTFSITDQFTQGQVISFATASSSGTLLNNSLVHWLTISKVGKPNVTGVNVTPFVNVPQIETQHLALIQSGSYSAGTITGSLTKNTGSSIISYNSSTGIYTANKRAKVTASITARNTTATPVRVDVIGIASDGTTVASSSDSTSLSWATATTSGIVEAGQQFNFSTSGGASDVQRASVAAEATSDSILTAPETFSSDTAALTYASSAQYTLSTLASAPVGTYITFTYAANTNTRTQTTTRPTQTDADMNANGIQVFARAYTAASSAAQPAAIAIQIGKGLKGRTLDLYKSAGKLTAGNLDLTVQTSTTELGAFSKDYNETTGILIVDVGICLNAATTAHVLLYSDNTSQTSGYLVINASKNVSLTGMNIERVSARAVNSSGTTVSTGTTITYDAVKTFDTHGALNTATGVFTAPETGYYQISGAMTLVSATHGGGSAVFIAGHKNNVTYSLGVQWRAQTTTTQNSMCGYSDLVYLAKGDTFKLVATIDRGATALFNDAALNYFSITKTNIGGRN